MTQLTQVYVRPTAGQFVAIWTYNGKVWSNTLRAVGGALFVFYDDDATMSSFREVGPDTVHPVDNTDGAISNLRYFVVKE